MSVQEFNRALKQNPDMKNYFESLPAYVQENIYMTSNSVENLDQLKSIVTTMTDRQG